MMEQRRSALSQGDGLERGSQAMVGDPALGLLAGKFNPKEYGGSSSAAAFGRSERAAGRKSLSWAAKTSSSRSGVAAAVMSSAGTERTSKPRKQAKLFGIMAVLVRRPRHKPIQHEVTVGCTEQQEKSHISRTSRCRGVGCHRNSLEFPGHSCPHRGVASPTGMP